MRWQTPEERYSARVNQTAAPRGRVKYKTFLITWAVLWLFGLGCIVAGFHGDLNVGFGSSLQSNTFRLCGTTTGWFAVVGLLSILGGVAMLVVALVSLASEKMKT